MPQKTWRSFTVARTFARSLKLKNSVAWHAWWKEHDRPADIPSNPPLAYAGDWAGWEDFLGDSYGKTPNKEKKTTTRKKKLGKRKRAGVRKRARTSESESAATKKPKHKKKTKKQQRKHHHQMMETTKEVDAEGRQKSNKPFARV